MKDSHDNAVVLSADEIVPTSWYNFMCDYSELLSKEDFDLPAKLSHIKSINVAPKQPLSLMKQSYNTTDREILIPAELREKYLTYRATPLRRAIYLERHLSTNTRIFYKYEGANISGSHKLNTALAQAYYYKKAGVKHMVTATGAGQWGAAIAYACKVFGLECTVFMVNVSLEQKPQRKSIIEMFGAKVHSSPSTLTAVGKNAIHKKNIEWGSLAIATAEAIECAREMNASFAVGSGENAVLLHQTIIGNEALYQMSLLNEFPEYVVACMGAGSNFAGISLPFMKKDLIQQGKHCRLVAAEPIGCPKLTRGIYAYDINDYSGTTPISKMYTLGSDYIAPPIHAGGLRYHGTSEFLSAMYAKNMFDAQAISQRDAISSGLLFSELEGILPAPESAHAIAAALNIVKEKKPKSLLINISGHGLYDLAAYNEARTGELSDGAADEKLISNSLGALQRTLV